MFISCFACAGSPIDLTQKNEETYIKIESDDESIDTSLNTDAPSFSLLLNEANKMYVVST